MNKKQKAELEAWAKKNGMDVIFECTYCRERAHTQSLDEGQEDHWLVTFVKPEAR